MTLHHFTRDQFEAYLRERQDTLDSTNQHNPFATSAWLRHWTATVAPKDGRFIVVESDTDDALMLLMSEDASCRHLSALTNYYASQYSAVIASTGDHREAAKRLAEQLLKSRWASRTVTLAPLYRSAPEYSGVVAGLSKTGWMTTSFDVSGNWHLPCSGLSFDSYMEGRPSELRNTWIRKGRKFTTTSGAKIEIFGRSDGRIHDAIDAYQRVYAKSWKQPEPYPEFVPGWARICAEKGWARMGVAWLQDEPIAAQFWFVFDKRAYIFKLAYDEQHAKMSAGTLLTARLMQHVLEEDRVAEVDFGTGDDAYKKTWMTERRERVGVRAVNLASAAGLAEAARTYGGAIKRKLLGLVRRPDPPAQASRGPT
jgi:hypothetical protein